MDTTARARTAALTAVALLVSACATASDVAGPTASPSVTPSATSPAVDPTVAPDPSPSTTTPTDPDAPLVTGLGGGCDDLGEGPADGLPAITFVLDGQLQQVTPSGGTTTCLADGVDGPITWGARGDRVLVGDTVIVSGDRSASVTHNGASPVSFTRPTGTSTLAIADDGRVLAKTALDDGAVTDISFLADHDEATYYPSGTHVLAIGTHADGRYGIWLATNTGTDERLLGEPEAGVTLHGMSIDDQGVHLVFTADHGIESHVHLVRMLGESFAEGTAEAAADAIITSDEPLGVAIVGSDGQDIAVASGSCPDGRRQVLLDRFGSVDVSGLPEGDAVPVGWTEYGELMVAVAPTGCVGSDPVDLWFFRDGGTPALLVSGVTSVALRPHGRGEPPPPPSENFSGFA